jgi:hypothetical protein
VGELERADLDPVKEAGGIDHSQFSFADLELARTADPINTR